MTAPDPHRDEALREEDLLPRLERVAAIARKLVSGELGPAASRRGGFGQGTLFTEHRRYSAGDDPRAIDWNAMARFDEVYVRVFEPEDAAPVTVVVDGSPSMGVVGGAKARQAALLGAAFGAIGLLVLAGAQAIETGGGQEGTYRGKEGLLPMARFFLASVRAKGARGPSLREAVRRTLARSRQGPLVIATDAVPPAELDEALRARGRRPTLVLHIVDPQEIEPRASGLARLVDPEAGTSRRLWLTSGLRARYSALARARLQEVEGAVLRARAGYVRISTETPFDAAVLEALHSGLTLRLAGTR